MTEVVISGSGLFTPEQVVTNDELVASFNAYVDDFNQQNAEAIEKGEVEALSHSSSAFIEKASGIKSRYVMYKDGMTDPKVLKPLFPKWQGDESPEQVHMAVAAAKDAMREAEKSAKDIDLVICATSNYQRPYPALAIEVQRLLGIEGYGYDMNVACSSATFGIIAAYNAVKSGTANCVLVVNPEFSTPQVNFRNRDSHFIFGDVCTATIIERQDSATVAKPFLILGTQQKTHFSDNIRCNSGHTNHCNEELTGDEVFFYQNGRKVFKELLPMIVELLESHFAKLSIQASDVKRMWLHQANINMNSFVAKKLLGREPEQHEAPIVLDEYANAASAGSVLAFHKYKADVASGELGIMCSFGAGYSIGCISLKRI